MRRSSLLPSLASLVVVAGLVVPASSRADYIDHFATRDDVGLYKVPSRGATRVLVIPVIVDDLPFEQGSEEAFVDDIDAFYADDDGNLLGDGFTFTRYWEQASLGRFRPTATVAPPVRFPACPPLGAYADCAIPRGAGLPDGDVQGAIAVLGDALDFLNEIVLCATAGPSPERTCTVGGGVDLADYDTSGPDGAPDGFVDGVIVVSNAAFPGIALPVRDLSQSNLLRFFGPFPEFSYDGVVVPSVAIAGRASRPQRQTWVSVHEFGHLLGFADLYNESGSTTDLPYTLMGGWFYDTPASLLDAFSRVAIGWANVVQVAGPGTFTLPTAATSGVVLKVGDGDEFFLVEHRQRIDGAVDGDLGVEQGVFVERVRLARRPSPAPGSYFNTLRSCVNCTAFDPMLMVEEADGRYDLQRGRARDDADDLFSAGDTIGPSDDVAPRSAAHAPFSTNRLDGGRTGLAITVEASSAEGASVTIEGPALADPCAALGALCAGACVVDDGGHGRCGDFLVFPPAPPDAAPDNPPGDADGLATSAGCGCSSAGARDGMSFVGLVVVAALAVVRRRRRDVISLQP
jgi:M6 family metalloprotease-like protein/MYXO-CTERM domain-containing protein